MASLYCNAALKPGKANTLAISIYKDIQNLALVSLLISLTLIPS